MATTLPSLVIGAPPRSILLPLRYKSLNRLVALPKSQVTLWSGMRCDSISPSAISISVAPSDTSMLVPPVKLRKSRIGPVFVLNAPAPVPKLRPVLLSPAVLMLMFTSGSRLVTAMAVAVSSVIVMLNGVASMTVIFSIAIIFSSSCNIRLDCYTAF